jgi:hypothetical protein
MTMMMMTTTISMTKTRPKTIASSIEPARIHPGS